MLETLPILNGVGEPEQRLAVFADFDMQRTGDILLPVFGIVGLKRWGIDPGLEKSTTLPTSEMLIAQHSSTVRCLSW